MLKKILQFDTTVTINFSNLKKQELLLWINLAACLKGNGLLN